jgi:membrane protein YdbS with pleckstrin-like domain
MSVERESRPPYSGPMADTAGALRDPAHRVSGRAPFVWAAGAVVRALLLAAAAASGVFLDWYDLPRWLELGYLAAALAYVVAMPTYRYRVHRWETTETAVYTQRGWFTRERRIAPMSRVQTVDLEQGILERVFGLASVTVTTASAAGPVKVDGLTARVAQRLVDDLVRRTEAEPGDAT